MIITLFNKTKAHNSTEVITGGNQVNGVLKEDCSIINPIVKLRQGSISSNITQYSYAYIAEFGRYYFVTDKIYVGGLWELHMHCDVLATWRSTIGNSRQYVMRSGKCSVMDDPANSPVISKSISVTPITNPFSDNLSYPSQVGANDLGNGVFIVILAGDPDNSQGTLIENAYALSSTEFYNFRRELSSTQYMGLVAAVDDLTDNVAKLLINPFQYVIKCFYIPISKSALFGNNLISVRIRYGWYQLTSVGYLINDPLRIKTLYDGIIPEPSTVSGVPTGQKYMYKTARWCQYSLEWSVIGKISIPNDEIIMGNKISIYANIDTCSGDVVLTAYVWDDTSGTAILKNTFILGVQNWAVSINLSSYLRDPDSVIDSGLGVVNTAQSVMKDLLTLDLAGAITDVTRGIESATTAGAQAKAATVQNIGAPGTQATICFPNRGIVLVWHYPSQSESSRLGYITREHARISDVSIMIGDGVTPALIICKEPVLAVPSINNINWTSDEYNEILNYMKTGFYYV